MSSHKSGNCHFEKQLASAHAKIPVCMATRSPQVKIAVGEVWKRRILLGVMSEVVLVGDTLHDDVNFS